MRLASVVAAATVALAAEGAVPTALAQTDPFSFYYQNVPLWSRRTPLSAGGASDFNRFRAMVDAAFGRVTVAVAYEHVATLRERRGEGAFVGTVPGGGEWLDLQWTFVDEEHVLWRHRFDRLAVGWRPSDAVEIGAGRQTVSWATTLFLTPADPFSPFAPADPFREFRAGVDAVRLRVYPGPLSEIDVVVRPTDNPGVGEELTALGRGLATWRGWELSAWGGSLYGDLAAAFGAAGSLGGTAIRAEGVVRRREADTVFRGVVGIDRRLVLAGRDLFLVVEYQRDGLGAESADGYGTLTASRPFLRGELQVLGRDELVVQGSYQIHPLVAVAALGLANLGDGSVLLAPSFSYSASDAATLSGGVFFGLGPDEPAPGRPLASEYGAVGTTAYVALSLFF